MHYRHENLAHTEQTRKKERPGYPGLSVKFPR